MRHLPLRRTWTDLTIPGASPEENSKSAARLARILRSWENTPYVCGQGHRQVGTDCVRSVVLILCEWTKQAPPDIDTLPPDAALHSREGAISSMRTILRVLPESFEVPGTEVEPGDVLIAGPPKGGPGHAIIVGASRNTIYQATSTGGFSRCGWSLPEGGDRVFSVRRFLSRASTF